MLRGRIIVRFARYLGGGRHQGQNENTEQAQ